MPALINEMDPLRDLAKPVAANCKRLIGVSLLPEVPV
jgi:hypothetical protein